MNIGKKTRLWCSPSWPSNSKSMTNHGCWILLNHAHTTMKMVEVSLVTTRLLYFCCLGKRVAFGRIQIFLAKRYRKTSGNSIYHHSSSLLEVVWSDSSRGPRSKASWHVAHEGFFDQTTGPSSLPTSLTCIPWLLKGTHLNHISSTPKMWCYPSGSFLWSSKQTARRLSSSSFQRLFPYVFNHINKEPNDELTSRNVLMERNRVHSLIHPCIQPFIHYSSISFSMCAGWSSGVTSKAFSDCWSHWFTKSS